MTSHQRREDGDGAGVSGGEAGAQTGGGGGDSGINLERWRERVFATLALRRPERGLLGGIQRSEMKQISQSATLSTQATNPYHTSFATRFRADDRGLFRPPRNRGAGRPNPALRLSLFCTSVAIAWVAHRSFFRGPPSVAGAGPYDGCFSQATAEHFLLTTFVSPARL